MNKTKIISEPDVLGAGQLADILSEIIGGCLLSHSSGLVRIESGFAGGVNLSLGATKLLIDLLQVKKAAGE